MAVSSEMTRGMPTDDGAQAMERRCIVTGRHYPRDRMIRFVKGPDGRIVADLDERLPGRGLWVLARRDVLEQAAGGRHFSRALKGPVDVPDDLIRQVETGVAARAGNLIGLARRAGAAVAGFEKTRAALKGGAVHLLIAARDAAEDGRSKLAALAPDLVPLTGLNASELGAVFGRDAVVHVAVTDARFAVRIARLLERLEGIRGASTHEDPIPAAAKVG